MDNRPISELDSAISVNDEDILLISQKENNEYVSRKIGAGVFRGDSAYELAVKEGFKGDLSSWLSSIKGWQPITSGEFVGLLDSELDKSKLYKDLNSRLNASTTTLREDINKQLNDINTLRQEVVAEADKRIQEIHKLNTGLIEEANKRIQDIKLVQESITLETSERLEQAIELANQILLEKDSRTDDIKNLIEKLNSEQSDRVAAVQEVVDLLSSEIETRRSLLSETVQKINKETADRVTEIDSVRNSITQEQLARVSELESIIKSIDAVDTKVGTNHSFLLNNYSTTKTASEETAKQIEALRSTYIDPILEEKASTTALEQVFTELGRVDDSLKANIEKVDGVFAQINPSMAGTESGFIGDESKYVGVWTEQSARIEADFALGERVDNVVATYTSNKETTDARIAREEKARADGDSALASVVTSLTTRVGNSEGKLITLEQVSADRDSSVSELSTKLDNTIQDLNSKASSSALSDLSSNVEVLEESVKSATNSVTSLKNNLDTVTENINKKADSSAVSDLSSKVSVLDETVTSNSNNIIALTGSLGSKNKTYYQATVPTENVAVGDVWVNSTPSKNNELKRYNGLYWDVISDPRVSSNSSAISSLESKTTQHDEDITSQAQLITNLQSDLNLSKENLLLKADSSALSDLSNTVSNVDGKVTSVSEDVTQLKSSLTNLEENVDSKADASALEDLSSKVEKTSNSLVSQGQDITDLNNSLVTVNTNINSKGKVIYSDVEPIETERLFQNLWIDTKDGNNTPKRWDGFKWEIVSDKVATEALAKAEANSEVLTTKADASAVSSLTNKVENVEKTVTSQSSDLVVLTNSLEQASQLAADKGKVIFSNVEPEESERILQNLWIDTSNNNNTPKRWTGTKWSTVTDKVALDALTASQAVSDVLTTKADSSAVSSLESKVTDLGESISSQSQDITTLNNSLVLANNTISDKGKIIYSDSAPAEGARLPQNLWIDTTSGGNIPKRWNGEFWLVITDKTALDALAAANQVKEDLADKVDSSAFNSLTSRVNSSEKAITSQSDSITKLNNDLTVTDQIAREALSDSKDLKEQITTKASTEALENLTSSVISIDGKVTTNTQKVLELTGTVEAIGENLSTKADASVLTDYSTKIDTNEAISKANTTLTSSYTKAVEDVRTETNTKLDDQLLITKASTSGKLLYDDATFLKGFNSVSAYDNNSTNKVVVARTTREIDNPTKSSHQLKITIANGATPGYGGFYQLVPSRANAIFVIKYLMKVPNTYTVIPNSNALGSDSSDKIIGSAAGTGKYETYVRVIRCGDSGSFSTGGHIYFYGTSLPKDSTDTVMLASIECWDATDFVKSATSDEVATISASLVNDYYTKTDADKAVSNSLTAFQTNYVDKELNKKASANTVDQISNEIHNTETGLDATAKKLSGVYAQVNPEFIGSEKGYIGKNSGSVSVWSEYSARIEGDLALSSRIDSVKADWEGNLASVQTQTKATSDKVSSLASQMTVLSSAVEGNISLVMDQYYTKVQTGQVVSQGISDFKANYVAPELNLKASSQALEQTQSQVTEIDGKLKTTSQRTEGVYAQVNPDLVGSDSGSIGTENQNVGSWSQYSALIEGDFATSQKIDVVSAAVANNTASIKQTNTVVIDKFKSVAESLNRVETKFNDNLSSVNSVIGVWSDKDKSISKYIIDLNSLVGSNQAEITKNYLTSADTTKAITEGIDRFKTEYLSDELKKKASAEVLDQVKSAIENTETGLVATADKLDGVFVKVNPKLIGSDRDFIGSTSSSVGIWTEYSARIEEDFALGNRIDNLYVNLGKNAAAIQTVNNVLVDKTQALAKSITHIDSKFESSVGSINTKLGTWSSSESSISDYITNINSAVGKNSSSIQIQGKSIDGLSSQYTVKLDTNGRVSGFGLASNPTNQATSEFAVVADKFYIASPDTNDKGKNPFYVLTKNQVADGVTIPAGVYIDQAFIRKASIDSVHIKDAAINDAKIFNLDAAKLTTGFISAERLSTGIISTDHLQVGAVTEAKFSPGVLNNYLTSNQFVSDSLSDNVLTASEKTSIKNNWEQIKNNLKFYLESAKIFDITIATPAYTDLSAYILTLNLDGTDSTQIDSELFKAKFNAWYAEEYAIRSAIDAKVKDLNKNSLNQATSATDLLNRWKANKNNTLYIDDNKIAVNMIAAENIAADSITADKIKFGGVSSQNLADDIKSDISKGMTANSKVNELIANLDDDNILTSVEKTFLYSKWQEVEKTSAWIAWQCFNIFGSNLDKETSYDPYFNLFKNFISENVSKDGLNKSTNISTITITVDGATYGGSEAMRRMMVAYYEAENKMLSKIQELQYKYTLGVDTKVSLAASVLDKLADDNIITKQEKPALKLQYTNIINDFDDLALAASNQGISSSVFATAYNDLVNVFNLIFQDMASDTSWPGDDLRAKMKDYSDQRGIIVQTLSNDAKNKANEAALNALSALQALGKMSDDNVITIYEKPALSFSWQNIINDYDELVAACVTQNVSSTEFKTAYTNLKQAVDLILANPKVDTEWDGADLRNRMKAYADARGVTVQRLSNDAKAKAEAAMAAITDAVSDRILTPSEKQQFKIKWIEEYQDFEKLKLKAQEAGINTSTGNYTGYVSAFNYVNDTFTPVWNSANNSQVDPTEWKTRFSNLRKYKALLENEISLVIKNIASTALTNTQQLTDSLKTKADSSSFMALDHDVKVIDGKVQAYGESITSLSADLSNKVGKGDVNSIISETQNGKKHIISTEGLDNNLYYPVTIAVNGLFSKISMLIDLGEAQASWATHGIGWSCGLTVTQRAGGWGSNSIDLTIEKFDYAWTNQSPVINVGQLGTMSSALFYVRGGSKYHFYTDSNCYDPQLRTEKKIFDEQYNIYVEPITYSSGLEPKSLKQNVQANAVATSTLRANVDEINGKVVAQSSSILNLQTNVDTISRDLTTKANSSVLAQYYTKDEADRATAGKIENFNSSFEIGGRNYFKKTTPLNPHQLQEVRRDLPDTPNGFYVLGSQTPSNNLRLPGVITGNGKWTISGWVRGSQNTAISFFIDICDKELSKQIVINKDGTNSWEKFTHTVTVDNYSSDTYNFVDISSLSWAYFFFKDIKIEKGSKATDWTPAPEDIDQKLTSIDASISTLQNTTANNTQSIATTQNQLNARFDALSVGGRNLWLNSRVKFDGNDGTSTVSITENYIEVTPTYNGGYIYVWLTGDNAGEYTISLDAEAPSVELGLGIGYTETGGSRSWVVTGKKRCFITMTRKDGERGLLIIRVYNSPSVKLSNFKLEKGNVATDWTPAPEDIEAKISTTDATINEFKQTQATKDSATAERINTVSTKVNDNEAAIKVQAQSINGINAQYTIKTDVNGKVAGIGLVNSGKSSEFAVTADTFRVSNGSTDIAPFTISNNEILFNGKVSFNNVTNAGNLVSNFSKTNSGTGWANYTGLGIATLFDGTNTPCMLAHTQWSVQVQSDKFKVDPAKSYEFTVWLWSEGGNTTGNDYIGINVFNSSGDNIVVTAFDVNNPNSNWDEGNPYFWHRGHGENYRDKWVKYTGYVLAAGTDLSSIKGVLGLNVDRCFRLKSNTDSMLFRILNYYNDGTTINRLYMVHPSVKEVDTNSLIDTVNNKKATSNLYYPGTTLIDGGKIQTGSITADRIQIGSLGRDNLTDDLKNTISTSADTSSQALDSASTANNKIDNLKIGGNNLVIPGYDSYTSSLTGFLVCIPQPYDIKDDITYTLSFIVKGAESVTTMGIGFAANYKTDSFGDFWNPDNSEGKKVWTGKLSSRYSKSFFYIWINSPCTVRDIQLEEGDKATSYQKNSDYRDMRPFISDMPNDKLQNKWAYIAYKKPQLSANEMMHYGYLEGDIVSQGYVNVGNTMFSDTKFDNTYIIFRTIVTPNSVVNSGLFNFIGDDAHSIYVNGQMLYSSTLYKGGGNIPFKLFSGANNVIDILVSNGGGGAGFSTTTSLQDLGKMCAPSLTAVELETNSKLINDILSDNVITTDEKQSLLITYKQIASEFDTWRGEAEALGIDVSGQISATNKLLSNSRPYLGWVCRNDSISSSDTLNDGERTTLMNALSDYYVSNKTITKLVTEKLRESKTKADKVTTAIKNSSNWDGVSNTLTVSRNNISGGKDLANLWTNQLFDPAFPSILDGINEGRHTGEFQGSNLIRLNGRHCIGDWSTRFYVKPGEQYIISCIGYNYSGVGFYTGLWITDDNGNYSTYPGYHGFVPLVQVGSTGGGWKFYEAIFTVPVGYDASTPLAARAHFFQDTFDFSVVHCKIANLAIKKVIKESGIDPQLVDRSKQAKQLVDDIVSDNKITPDEKQSLLVTYKQISNDNDIWRNQAYLIGIDYSRQLNATTTLLPTSRPYLGWVCRGDALNQTDTLNAGERTTLMNALAEYHAANQDLAQRVGSYLRTTANTASGIASGARDLLNRWKANGNGTLYIDDNHIAVNKIGANEIAAGAITADHIYGGTITGDKIKAGTEISAPKISGGSINIGNGNFVVDQWGNLSANSGTFRGTVLAENISGKIDVASLKKSAIMSGYKMYFAMNQVPAGTTLQKDFNAFMADIVFYNKKYEWLSADYVSRGAISYYYGTKGADVGAICFSLTVECVKSKTITQKVLTVDDYVDLVIESLSGVEIHKQLNIGYGRVQQEVSFTLNPGTYVINYVLRNTGWGPCSVNIVGDIVDNDSIFFA